MAGKTAKAKPEPGHKMKKGSSTMTKKKPQSPPSKKSQSKSITAAVAAPDELTDATTAAASLSPTSAAVSLAPPSTAALESSAGLGSLAPEIAALAKHAGRRNLPVVIILNNKKVGGKKITPKKITPNKKGQKLAAAAGDGPTSRRNTGILACLATTIVMGMLLSIVGAAVWGTVPTPSPKYELSDT